MTGGQWARLAGALLLVACSTAESGGGDRAAPGSEVVARDTVNGIAVTVRGTAVDSVVAPDAAVPATARIALGAKRVAPSAPVTIAAPHPPGPPGETLAAASAVELAELRARLLIPVKGVVAAALRDSYSERRGGGARAHEALDIPAPRGTPVLAAVAGRVLKLHRSTAGGLMIYAADQSDRFILMYAHLDRYAPGLAEGMPLRQGQEIGAVGSTGNASSGAPHLHFAILRGNPARQWWRGQPTDPYPLLTR